MNATIAGSIPSDKIQELEEVEQAFRSQFDARFVDPTEEALLRDASQRPNTDALVVPWTREPLLTPRVFEAFKELQLIVSTYGGVKRNVAVDVAVERGVRLTCTGKVRARSVAEFTLALTMDQLLNVSRIHHAMRGGKRFPRFGYTQELTAKTVGVIGFGAISEDFLELLTPFRTTNLVFSSHATPQELRAKNAAPAELDDIAARSDVVAVLTGLTPKTQEMIGEEFLKAMKDGALLVNTARGKLIDEAALIRELETGRINAALDVYYEEPLDEDSPLRNLENVTLTAHSANSTREMDLTRWEFALNELRGFQAGRGLAGELDSEHIARMSDD